MMIVDDIDDDCWVCSWWFHRFLCSTFFNHGMLMYFGCILDDDSH